MNVSSRRLRSLLVSSMGKYELEGREGTMGHPIGLATLYFRCMAVHQFG